MPLNRQRLAPHKARSVASIVIKATNPKGEEISIGAIKSMERRLTRNMTRRRELDSDPPGQTVELIPGAVTTFELTLRRAMLYRSGLLEGFGINGVEDLISQNVPLDIIEERNNPDGTVQRVTYKGCYFREHPLSIDLDGDWLIVQDAVLEVANAVVAGSAQQADISPDSLGSAFQVTNTTQGPPEIA